jgi:hypothetical protein
MKSMQNPASKAKPLTTDMHLNLFLLSFRISHCLLLGHKALCQLLSLKRHRPHQGHTSSLVPIPACSRHASFFLIGTELKIRCL